MSEVESCSVCGRTILAGERTRIYLTNEGERRAVCDLCRERAEHVGWVWEEVAPDSQPPAGRRRGGLSSLLRGWGDRRRAEPARDVEVPEAAPEPADAADDEAAAEPVPAAEAAPAPEPPTPHRRSPDPAAPGAGIGRTASAVESRMSRIERAIERFNASEQSVMIAGLARTLGGPWVSVGAAAGSPNEVRITVAWELSWYQWGVDIADELQPVYEIAKGGEVDELDGPARQWNARMEADGRIELGVVPLGRADADPQTR